VNVTFYDKEKFENISESCAAKLAEITNLLKCFGPSSNRTLVIALLHKETGKRYIVINIHAEYPKANTTGPWKTLRKILSKPSVMVVCGDFNLTVENISFYENEFKDFKGKYVMMPTPDYANIGPATLDFILTSF
jgi:endonuclease/exonuclease/phosphatase family metal-dependent hydrolase